MGKQTKKSGSHFGGTWTQEKLSIIDDYLKFYVTALSKKKVKLVYIDAFAGSGKTILPDGQEVDGSAILSLQYNFDEFYFIEIDPERASALDDVVKTRYPHKYAKVHIINENCNETLTKVLSALTVYNRAVMFLDPYALELDWSVLETAKNKEILDIWYLFPLNALTRNLPKQKNLTPSTSAKIDRILGTHDWENALYQLDAQISLFGDSNYTRVNFNELVNFVTLRLKETFPYVSPKSRMLKNSKNSALFILFFIMTNKSTKAIGLGSKVVNEIFAKVDNMTRETMIYEED